MYGTNVEQLDLVAGGSPELAAAFETVAETEAGGSSKFPGQVCRKLMHSVVCRAYAPAILELCHLITVAEACGRDPRRYEEFFWGSGPASAAGFRAYVDRELFGETETAPHFVADGAKVDIRYADGSFAITYGRMPFLSALAEFLVTVLGYGELDNLWQSMLSRGPTSSSVSETANRLARLLYGYLKNNLPTAQSHKKFACLVAYLRDLGEGDFGPTTIDDPAVLDFWLQMSVDEGSDGLDFRTFASVFRAFVRLRQVLEEARDFQAMGTPQPIGPDREAGEVDPDSIRSLVETVEEAESPLAALRSPPADAIKFLNKSEAADLELLDACGKSSFALPLSLLRCEVFGAAQARLTQAQRRKVDAEAFRALVEQPAPRDYQGYRDRLAQLAKHVDRVLLASLEVLALARRTEAVSVVTALRPEIDLSPLAKFLFEEDDEGTIVSLDGGAFRERLMAAMACPQTVGPELAALIAEAGKALKGLSRQGFGIEQTSGPEAGEGFAHGAEALIEIRRHLTAFQGKLGQMKLPHGDWEKQFGADSEIFRKQFLLLYGVAA